MRIGSIVVGCMRFDEMLVFWQAALGHVPDRPPQDGWVILTHPTGAGPHVSLTGSPGTSCRRSELSRVHLDLYTTDLPAEVERLLGLGATRYDRETGPRRRLRGPRGPGWQPLLRRHGGGRGERRVRLWGW